MASILMGPQHSGPCRIARRFTVPGIAEVAHEVEEEGRLALASLGAGVQAVPLRISHLLSVGEGLALSLMPEDPRDLNIVGDFKFELEIAVRPRFSRRWERKLDDEELRQSLRSALDDYTVRLSAIRGTGQDQTG